MPEQDDELIQAAVDPTGDEMVMPAKSPVSGFVKFLQATGRGVRFQSAVIDAGNVAIDEWVHGRFTGSGEKAYNYFLDTLSAPQTAPRTGHGAVDALQAGYQASATGLAIRGKLPDVVLDPSNKKWYESALATAATTVSDLPEMIVGGLAGTLTGLPSGPGALVVGGAGAFAFPTAIRQSLMTAYSLEQVQSSSDFLNQVQIGILETGKSAIVGGITGPAGMAGRTVAGPLATRFGATGTRFVSGAAGLGTEGAVLAVAPAALEGRLPEKEDFINTAILLGGFKSAHAVSQGLRNIYARTGIRPEEVARAAQADPTILEDLAKTPVPEPKVASEAPTFKSTVDIVDSTSYQGNRQGALLGPVDEHLVARDPASGKDIGRLWVTKTPEGFEVRKVEVDPKFRGRDVATQLYLQARERFGPYQGSTDTTPDGQALLAKLRVNHPGVFEPSKAALIEPEPEVPRAFQDAADRQAVADAVPGGEPVSDTVKAMAAELFGPPVKVPGEPEPTHVNYRYLNTPEQVNGALARMSELNLEEIQRQRRGEVPWEQTEHEAGLYLSRLLGADTPIQAREPGTAAGAAELLARKQLVEGASLDMVAKAKAIAEAPGMASPEQLADLLVSVDRAAMVQAEFLGARAEAGRSLNILKDTKSTAEHAEQIRQVLAKFGKDPVELAKQLAVIDNPEAAARAARGLTKVGWEQKALEGWKAGLVSGPVTQVANVMGNTTYAATRPLVDATASILGMVTRAEDRVHYTEPLARVIGNFQGTWEALKVVNAEFMRITKPENAFEAAFPGIRTREGWRTATLDRFESPGGKSESRMAISGDLGYAIRTPFRALEALDVMFRTMNERGEAAAMAAREAAREGYNPLTREFRERVADLANNPPEDWIDSIEAFGERAVFRTPLGEKGKAITEAIVKNHLEWVVPFRGTPANIAKELVRLSPAAPIIGEWRADIAKGGVAQAKAVAEMTVGSSIAALAMSLAFSGHISGAGDPDPAKRRVKAAAGWQPYSVKIGNTWYSYQRFQPVGTLVGMAADIAEVWEHLDSEESDKVPRMLSVAFSNAITNQTFLQGITMLVDAISEPDRKGPRLVQNLTASAVPAVVGQSAQFTDEVKREVTSTREAVMNRIPGLREQLPPQRDPWGEPMLNPERLGGISPIIEANPSTDLVRTEAARLGVGAQKAPKHVTMPTRGLVQGPLSQVQLTPEQRDVFASVAGKTAHAIMTPIVNAPEWKDTPDIIKAKIYQAVIEKSNRLGSMAALSDQQRQLEIERVVGEVTKRLEK